MKSFPPRLVTVPEMIAIEREANNKGLPYAQMMENAGQGLAEVVDARYQLLKPGPVLGLVGSGNNGGDTLVALDYLASWGWQVEAYLAALREQTDPLVERARQGSGRIVSGQEDLDFERLRELMDGCSILLDGVLGTGIRLPLRGRVAQVLEWVSAYLESMDMPPAIVAVDCPSGVDSDNGEVAPQCFPADLTVTMAAMKTGLLKFPAYDYVGELELVGIGLNDEILAWRSIRRFVPEEGYVIDHLPDRPLDAHKGTFGTALIVAGSKYYTGAALLAGQAAYRSGAGLVTLGVPEHLQPALAGHFLEATWLPLPENGGVISAPAAGIVLDSLERPTSLLVGLS